MDIPTDDMWLRDTGPVFLLDRSGAKAAVDFNFNVWGAKRAPGHDAGVASAIIERLGYPLHIAKVTGEGGGLEFDGEGTLLLKDSCWVNDNRNPGLGRDEIAAELKAALGVEKVIWLPGVRGQDETDGHIDGSIRFVRPGLVMTSGIVRDTSEWGVSQDESKAILAASTDAKGRSFDVVEVPWPERHRSEDEDFFYSYANFYVGNGAVYTPEFGDPPADTRAQEALAELFPGRRIVALNVDRIYENGGGIHCVTQQEPA